MNIHIRSGFGASFQVLYIAKQILLSLLIILFGFFPYGVYALEPLLPSATTIESGSVTKEVTLSQEEDSSLQEEESSSGTTTEATIAIQDDEAIEVIAATSSPEEDKNVSTIQEVSDETDTAIEASTTGPVKEVQTTNPPQELETNNEEEQTTGTTTLKEEIISHDASTTSEVSTTATPTKLIVTTEEEPAEEAETATTTELVDELNLMEGAVESVIEFFTGVERVQSALELAEFATEGLITPMLREESTETDTATIAYGATFNSNFIFEERSTGLEASLLVGLSVQTADRAAFDVAALGIEILEDGTAVENLISGIGQLSLEFGIPGQHLVFSQPVELSISTNLPSGTTIDIQVQHAGSELGTEGITMNPNAACVAGISTDENNTATVTGGAITFYTCGASTFILDPDSDANNEATAWFKADAGTTGATGDNDTLTTWVDQSTAGNDATATNTPALRTASTSLFNFNPVVEFDGSTDSFSFPNPLLNGNNPAEMYMVTAKDSGTAGENIVIGLGPNVSGGGHRWRFSHESDNSIRGTWRSSVLTTGASRTIDGTQSLAQLNYNTTTGRELRFNGELSATSTLTNLTIDSALDASIGRRLYPNGSGDFVEHFDGRIAELLVYPEELSPTQRVQIQSYMALKYGITLDVSVSDYQNSAATSIYDLTDGYASDVFGLGQDNATTLDQRVSKSANDSAILTLSTNLDFAGANPGARSPMGDGNFVVVGNNGATSTAWTATGAPSGFEILEKVWNYDETGTIGSINLQFDVDDAQFDVPALSSGPDYYVILDTNNNQSFADEIPVVLTNTSGSFWSHSGDLLGDRLFTLAGATTPPAAPGGVSGDLALWLKADADVTTGATMTWADQSGSGLDVSQSNAVNQPVYSTTTDLLNFNPSLRFSTASSSSLVRPSTAATAVFDVVGSTSRKGSAFFAGDMSAADRNPVFIHNDGGGGTFAYEFGSFTGAGFGFGSSGNSALSQTNAGSAIPLNVPFVGSTRFSDASTPNIKTYFNGGFESTGADSDGSGFLAVNQLSLGGGSGLYDGRMGEIIAYDVELTETEQQRIDSYLAIKYGITLDQTTPTDYVL